MEHNYFNRKQLSKILKHVLNILRIFIILEFIFEILTSKLFGCKAMTSSVHFSVNMELNGIVTREA